ncbi:CopD family protein [Cytobacillus suaedae]|nr:CopD family protein [Cytobacillus suaedae]
MGSFILHLIPSRLRPDILVPKQTVLLSILGIALLSFFPIVQLVLVIYKNIGLGTTLTSVIYTFEVGQAWLLTFFVANVLIIYVNLFDFKKKTIHAYVGLLVTIVLILSLGWASHASSLTEWSGFITHSVHFLAVSVWTGIFLVTSWFSRDNQNWLKFLHWFSPIAILCLLTIVGTGFYIMSLVVDVKDYTDSWMISYGQTLLIKHLLIIPLLVFAFINSYLIRKRMKLDTAFNPKPWAKVESIILLMIFSATAVLGQQSPPHDIETTLRTAGISKLFTVLYQDTIYVSMDVSLQLGIYSLLFSILSALFLVLTILMFVKKAPILLSFITSMLLLVNVYLALMLSVV